MLANSVFGSERGQEGESLVAAYLMDLGYRVRERNFHSLFGEIDIVAWSPEGVLVFVKVKYYKHDSMIDVRYSLTRGKQKKLVLTARRYMAVRHVTDVHMRFDFITVSQGQIQYHFENVILVS